MHRKENTGSRKTEIGNMKRIIGRIFLYLTLVMGAFLICIPLWWMVTTSIKPEQDVFLFPPKIIPTKLRLENYTDVFIESPFLLYVFNTVKVTILVMIGQVFSSAVVGYGFAKLRFPGRRLFFILLLSTMMIPYHSILVPQFVMFKWMNWIDTYLPLIVPHYFATPFYVFLFRQFFMGIHKEYNDSARIDGCGYWGTFIKIMIPMSLPIFGTVTIFSFNGVWNDFLAPLIYINTSEKMTLQLGINSISRTLYTVKWNIFMAASVLALIPTAAIFFLFQKKMIQGVVVTGIKG